MNLDRHLARMSTPAPRTYLGHDPSHDIPGHEGQGCDLLLTVYPAEGETPERLELATRPGHRQQWLTWSPPIGMGETL